MHDIVRDFTLASQADSGLERLQRSFVNTIVISIDSATDVVRKYAYEHLQLHVRGAVSVPLSDDPSIRSWLLDLSDDNIVDAVLQGVKSSDAEQLAQWLEKDQQDLWAAARLYAVGGSRQYFWCA